MLSNLPTSLYAVAVLSVHELLNSLPALSLTAAHVGLNDHVRP